MQFTSESCRPQHQELTTLTAHFQTSPLWWHLCIWSYLLINFLLLFSSYYSSLRICCYKWRVVLIFTIEWWRFYCLLLLSLIFLQYLISIITVSLHYELNTTIRRKLITITVYVLFEIILKFNCVPYIIGRSYWLLDHFIVLLLY